MATKKSKIISFRMRNSLIEDMKKVAAINFRGNFNQAILAGCKMLIESERKRQSDLLSSGGNGGGGDAEKDAVSSVEGEKFM